MSQVIRDELARLKDQRNTLGVDMQLLREQETALHLQREEVLKKIRTKNWEQGKVEKQIEKLDEFLDVETW